MSETNPPVVNGTAPATPTGAPAAAPPALPLFFKGVVGVNPGQHSALRLDRTTGFGFAAAAQSIPVGLGEMEVVGQHYPIVFTVGPVPTPVALMGLKEGTNPFVMPDGTWRPDSYVPAYVRAFPFIFVEDQATSTLYVGMDPSAASVSGPGGAAMFEDGKPSPALTEAINFCAAFRDNLNAGIAFAKALDEAGLLEEEEATINFNAGGTARVRGFKILKMDRLQKISDETFLEWRRRGWIGAIYAHYFSNGRWARLVEMSVAPVAPVVPAA
jgi:hypothetical protein